MKWEYKSIRLEANSSKNRGRKMEAVLDTLDPILNEAGEDGWELTSIFSVEVVGYTAFVIGTFKRPKK